jgi:hypothetical protein
MMKKKLTNYVADKKEVSGRVAVPILMYLLGVPGIFVLILWFLFFRGA